MKKDVKKLLSSQASSILPEDRVKDQIKEELGFQAVEHGRAYAHGGTDSAARKRGFLAAIAAAAAVILCLCIILPIALKGGGLSNGPGNKFNQIQTAEDFYAYGAASVGSLLSQNQTRSAKTLAARNPSEEEMQIVNRYMALVEGLMGEGNIKYTANETENGEFAYSMNVTYKDLLGKDVSYRMYYNRTYLGGETEGDEREEYYSLSGVLLVNGGRYPVEGSIETEEEEGETESELFFRAFIDDTSYIEVKQEYEEETENGDTEREQKYVYSVYRNGALSERTEVEYESEEGGLELKMVVESESGKDELYFEQKKGGSAQLQVHGKINGEQVRFTVYVLTRQDGSTYYRYEFENGADFDDERYGDDDDEDDD